MGSTLKLHSQEREGVMEFGLPEVAALASSGAIGALIVWGYHKWIKR